MKVIGGLENLSYEKVCTRTVHLRKGTNEGEYDKDILNPVYCSIAG